MTTFVVTFGQKYRYDTHPACPAIDNNAFLRIDADDELAARQKLIASSVGYEWAFMYEWDEFEPQIAEYGLWDVTMKVASYQLTQSERATFQSLVARGVSPMDAREDALDGVDVETVREGS